MINIDGKPLGILVSQDTTIADIIGDLATDDTGYGGMSRVYVTSGGSRVGMLVVVLGPENVERVNEKITEIAAEWKAENQDGRAALH